MLSRKKSTITGTLIPSLTRESIKETIGCSPMANALGATIKVAFPKQGMYLITGNGAPPDSLLKSQGGSVVLRMAGFRALATLPFQGYMSLQGDHRIASIGPVTVDTKRLAKMVALLGKSGSSNPGR